MAFQNRILSGIDGLIWSRRSTGNFLGNTDDLVFVHNQLAKRPLPTLADSNSSDIERVMLSNARV